MRRRKSPEDLTIDELRQLMVEKRRKSRSHHLERFRKTGRVISLASDIEPPPLEHLHSNTLVVQDEDEYDSPGKRKRRALDRFLLAVEVLAVFGLVFILYSGFQALKELNLEYSQSLTPATRTPTSAIVPVVLPSGHTSPISEGGARPNKAEIPTDLLEVYEAQAQAAIPTPGVEQATQIQIPAIEVDAPIVQGDSWEQLKKGVAQHIGSAEPGQVGNMVLSAHNDVFGEIFRHLDQLEEGDQIIIITANNSYTYLVTAIQVVEPTEVEVMASTPDPTITLISCYPYLIDNQRIVVQGSLTRMDQ